MQISTFPVRIYDVDAFGALRTNVLLRFFWQTASDATAAIGYDIDWYERQGTLWIIRRTELEVSIPARYRDQLAVRTWVSDIRRVRSQREYEVRRTADDALLARGTTDWVYVDLARGTLVTPPAALQAALMPAGVVARRRPLRPVLMPPPEAFSGSRGVELADLDTVAHVNNAQYAVYVEQALWDALRARGWTIDARAGAGRLCLQRHDLEYFESAEYGDALAVTVWLSALRDDGLTSECRLDRAGTRILHATSTWQWSGGALPSALRAAAATLLTRA
jgi:YbgC/YbaW family acyl-CoA thioester hydrolase